MNYVTLGRDGINVSKIGIGCWQASPDIWEVNEDEIVNGIVRSHELGVNLIDTAEEYGLGHSELVVGRAVKKLGRDNVIVATKVNPPHLRFLELQRACEASLKRLDVKQIDLYQIHWPDPYDQVPLRHTMKALEKLYTEGKIRAIGVSNFAVRDLEEARSYLSRTDIVSNQLRYNLIQREIEEEILPYCRRNKISILAWSPLALGLLTGKYRWDNKPTDKARESNPIFSDHNLREIEKLLTTLSELSKKRGKTIGQIALNWLMKDPLVIPIPGARNRRQAEENSSAADWDLTNQELNEIDLACNSLNIEYFP